MTRELVVLLFRPFRPSTGRTASNSGQMKEPVSYERVMRVNRWVGAFLVATVVGCGAGQRPGQGGPDLGGPVASPADVMDAGPKPSTDAGTCGTSIDQEGCSCDTVGDTHNCYVGAASQANIGTCT